MPELDRLNELLAELNRKADSQNALLLEHLDSARFYLSGRMPAEYRLSLDMARKELRYLKDDAVRSHVEEFIRNQFASTAQNHRALQGRQQ